MMQTFFSETNSSTIALLATVLSVLLMLPLVYLLSIERLPYMSLS